MKTMVIAATLCVFTSSLVQADCLSQYQAKIARLKADIAQQTKPFGIMNRLYPGWKVAIPAECATGAVAAGVWNLGIGSLPGCGVTVVGASVALITEHALFGAKVSPLQRERDELESVESAYSMLQEASVQKSPGTEINATITGKNPTVDNQAMLQDFQRLENSWRFTPQEFAEVLDRANSANLFCDSSGDVDGAESLFDTGVEISAGGSVMTSAAMAQGGKWDISSFDGTISAAKATDSVDTDAKFESGQLDFAAPAR